MDAANVLVILPFFLAIIGILAMILGHGLPVFRSWSHERMRARTQVAHVAVNRERLDELVLLSKIGTRTGTTPPEFRSRLRWLEGEHGHLEGVDSGYVLSLQEELIEGLGGN